MQVMPIVSSGVEGEGSDCNWDLLGVLQLACEYMGTVLVGVWTVVGKLVRCGVRCICALPV